MSTVAENEVEVREEVRREEEEETRAEPSSGEESEECDKKKRRKGGKGGKGGKSKKSKKPPVTEEEETDSSAPTPTGKRSGPIPWRSAEAFLEALASGEATIVARPGSRGGVTVRFGKSQNMMDGYTLNLLAFIAAPEMVYTEGSFQKQLAKLAIDLRLTGGLSQMMGRTDQPTVYQVDITATKFAQARDVLLSMVRGTAFNGTDQVKAFAEVTEKVMEFLSNSDKLVAEMGKRNCDLNRRYNAVMEAKAKLEKAEQATIRTELDAILEPVKQVGRAFPEIASMIKDMEEIFDKKIQLLEMAKDASLNELQMAETLGIDNPERNPHIIRKFLQNSPALLQRFKDAHLDALTAAPRAAPVIVAQAVPATSLVAPPTISPYPTIMELAHAVLGSLSIKKEGDTLPADDIRMILPIDTLHRALEISFRRFCAPHVTPARRAKMQDYNERVVDVSGAVTVTPRTEEEAIAALGLGEGQFEMVIKLFHDTYMGKVTAIVLHDVQYDPPAESGQCRMLPALKFAEIITGIVRIAFEKARNNLEIPPDANLVAHKAVAPDGFTELVWGADLLDFLNAVLLEIRCNGNYNKRSLTLLCLLPITPAEDGACMRVMKLIMGQLPDDIPAAYRGPLADSILFVLLSCGKPGLYHIATFIKDMEFTPDRPCFIEVMTVTETRGFVSEEFVYKPPAPKQDALPPPAPKQDALPPPAPKQDAPPPPASDLDTLAGVAAALAPASNPVTLAGESLEFETMDAGPTEGGSMTLRLESFAAKPAELDCPDRQEVAHSFSLGSESPIIGGIPESPMETICKAVIAMAPATGRQRPLDEANVKKVLSEATHGALDTFKCSPDQVMDSTKILNAVFDMLAEDNRAPDMFEFKEALDEAYHAKLEDVTPADTFIRAVVHQACIRRKGKKDVPLSCCPEQFRQAINFKITAALKARAAAAGAEVGSE
jgi:hypothetical protein